MYVYGILSVAQMLFLPGLLLLRALRLRPGLAASLLASVPLSLTINHFLVVGLVLVRGYRPAVLLAVVALELALLLALEARAARREGTAARPDLERLSAFHAHLASRGTAGALVWWTLLCAAGLLLVVHLSIAVQNVGTVFDVWDAVVSWNRWAVAWAGNALPELTWRYPQLLPANISLTYVLTRSTSVQFFAKAAMGVFPLGQLLMLADLAVRRRNPGYLAALALLGTMNVLAHRLYLTSGFADLPVAFMVMASIYLAALAEDAPDRRARLRWLGLAVACGAGAALTKQAGLLWAAVVPILAAVEARRLDAREAPAAEGAPPRARRTARLLGAWVALSLALFGPWYLYKTWQIRTGRDSDERALIALVNGHQTYPERAAQLYRTLAADTSRLLVNVFLPLAALGALLSSRWRWPALLYGLPYVGLCSVLTNYDLRNLAAAWPVLFTAGGGGWAEVLSRSRLRQVEGPRLPRFVPVAAGLALAAWAPRLFVDGYLSRNALSYLQRVRQREIGLPSLNEALYAYDATRKLGGRIVTNYQLLKYLPSLGDLYVYDEFLDLEAFRRSVEDPGNRYVLVPVAAALGGPRAAVRDHLEAELAAGGYRQLLEAGPPWATYRLLEIERRPRE